MLHLAYALGVAGLVLADDALAVFGQVGADPLSFLLVLLWQAWQLVEELNDCNEYLTGLKT